MSAKKDSLNSSEKSDDEKDELDLNETNENKEKKEELERIEKTIEEMLNRRKYKKIVKNTDADIPRIFAVNDRKEKFCVFLRIIPKLNAEEMQAHVSMMEEMNIPHALLIHHGEPTPAVNNTIVNIKNIGKYIELFNSIDLLYNCTKHELVPLHEKVTKKETDEIISKGFVMKMLPKITCTDPIVKFYGFRPGDLIKITRSDSIIFRVVVKK